jgi:pimeloyl-ACP methyl ester carboxylesterase
MKKLITGLAVDISPPEFAKFKSPLILIHGLWTNSSCWTEWATDFSNLGWECWSINFRGRAGRKEEELQRLTAEVCKEDLKGVIRNSTCPPVLLAHGFGGRIARLAAAEEEISALIQLSSTPTNTSEMSRPLKRLRLKYGTLLFLRRAFSLTEKDFNEIYLNCVPRERRVALLTRMTPESPHLIREFLDGKPELYPANISYPQFLVGGSADAVMPIASLRLLAAGWHADLLEYSDHGHWLMGESGGEKIVRDIHRRVVQKLGEHILLADFSSREDRS